MVIRRARDGESIYDIAAEYGIAPQYLKEISGINSRALAEGREVGVVTPSRTYVVRGGDTLTGIAHRFAVSERDIVALNPELTGGRRLYRGQYLVLKLAEPRVGVAVTNGYLYRGTSAERLRRVLPYLNVLTVAAARARGKEIMLDGSMRGTVELARAAGVYPMLRIFIEEMPEGEREEFAIGATMLARAGGYAGITLGGLSSLGGEASEFVLGVRRRTMDEGMTLGVEGVLGTRCGYTEYADYAVLTYDKLHLKEIPSFDDGERRAIVTHAEEFDVANAFLDLPAFSLSNGEYLSREETISAADKRGTIIEHSDEEKSMTLRRGRREAVTESMENVQGRIRLGAENGYLGVAYDIARVPFSEIFMAFAMLARTTNPPTVSSPLNCIGERREE